MSCAGSQPSSWPRDWDRVGKPANDATALKLINTSWRNNAEMLRVLAFRRAERGLRDAKKLSRRYLLSESARIAAIASAVCASGRRLDGSDPAALSLVFALLPKVNPWRRSTGRLVAFPKEKLSGGDRYVYRASIPQAAIGKLTKAALSVLFDPEPTQFMSAGGLPAFEAWLREHLSKSVLVLTTDIPNQFESARRAPLESGLPLPRRAMEEVLFRPKDRATILRRGLRGLTPTFHGDPLPEGVLPEAVAGVSQPGGGLAQGTAPASLAAEFLVGIVLRAVAAVSKDILVASFGDNLIFLLLDAKAEEPLKLALASAVEQTFGHDVLGSLTRRTHAYRRISWFSFCGREYRWKRGRLQIGLSAQRAERSTLKMQVEIEKAIHSNNQWAAVSKIERSILGRILQNREIETIVLESVDQMMTLRKLFAKEFAQAALSS